MEMTLFYLHRLDLTFTSAQTLQVIKDYAYLSQYGYKIHIFGTYNSIDSLNEIKSFLKNFPSVKLYARQKNQFNSLKIWLKFIRELSLCSDKKILITRHFKKLKNAIFLKKFFKNSFIMHEMHEESFTYQFKKISKTNFIKTINKSDIVIFTNPSQLIYFKKEFGDYPKFNYIILPNGVEYERFKTAKMKQNYIITYTGQFNKWKNTELIFKTLSLLPKSFTLRIAGGKNNTNSSEYINNMIQSYNLQGRVDYKGFVNNNEIPNNVLNNSHILFLPLGDNIQSKYLTSPMKLFEYISTNIPVLAVGYPTINSIVTTKEIFLCKNDPKDCAKQILSIVSIPNDELNKKIYNMNLLAKKYSYQNRSKTFDNALKTFLLNFC